MPSVKVSILMLTYNRSAFIARAIDSVCRQSLRDWELIIVQDGANSQTEAIVSARAAAEPRIRYLQRGVVGPVSVASNFGLALASGEYIAILDDDDAWSEPDKLARQVDFLDRHPEYVACGGGYILIDQEGRQRGTFLKPEDDSGIRTRALLANPIANSTAVFRRLIGGRPALYDPTLRGYADWDFWLSLGGDGKLYNFPHVLAYYALWEGGGSFRQHKVNARAGIRIVWKHRREYRGIWVAFPLAVMQYAYACLPRAVRRLSYHTLSSFKKTIASSGTPEGNA
jgi:glycosyltransferase involved in cell wall biosynthesis